MGRRSQGNANIENLAPPQKRPSSATTISQRIEQRNMKTRSSKTQSDEQLKEKPATAVANEKSSNYPVIQQVDYSASTVIEIEVPYESVCGRSPLLESSRNEQTPEKCLTEPVSKLISDENCMTGATPTTNLKILCEAVDHNKSTTTETSEVVDPRTGDPVTPTANLKMLLTAASPEIRSLELSKSRLFTDDDEDDQEEEEDDVTSRKTSKNSATRKQKSLGILCRRFMAQFEENPPQTSRIEVCLDELAAHLGTERRRIYDIVNVLESVEMMSRRAKNRYLWHGKTNLNATLVKLKYFAETEKVAKQLELVRELELARLYGRKSKNNGFIQSEVEAVLHHPKYKEYMELFGDAHKKERSLGVMSQKFLMLFLTGKTKTINLDMAAKILLGDPMVETKQTNSQFKTKIRRLYDIANILASINLICKVHVTELRGRKPAFSYIGPDVEELSVLDEYQYLKNVEVIRPGRTTLDMKMEELKKKMEAHIAAEQQANVNNIRQLPPVTVQAPDLEEIRQNMASGSGSNLSRAAAEHAAAKKDRSCSRAIKPKSSRPFVVIQGMSGGAASVVTTSTAPVFMDLSQHPIVSTSSQDQMSGLTLLPIVRTAEGSQLFMAHALQQSPGPRTPPNSNTSTRRILPQLGTKQTLTLYTPPTKATGEVSTQQKRTSSQAAESSSIITSSTGAGTTSALVQAPDGTFSTFFLTKTDNEYFLINKKPKVDTGEPERGESLPHQDHTQQHIIAGATEIVAGNVAATNVVEVTTEDGACNLEHTGQVIEVYDTPMTSHMSPSPVPVVYSTPSTVRCPPTAVMGGESAAAGIGGSVSQHSTITGTQITFLASPIPTPIGTPVEGRLEKDVPIPTTQQTVRTLTLKQP